MSLAALESALAAAKAACDAAECRRLLPLVNAARRAAKEVGAANAADMLAQGRHPDGRPMTPNEKIMAALFGVRRA